MQQLNKLTNCSPFQRLRKALLFSRTNSVFARTNVSSPTPTPTSSSSSPLTAIPEEVFYMRPLPSSCIDWQSPKGRVLFAQALAAGTMECYFPLAAQFVTQGEPAYCGPATLAQVLNALNIDPGRVWKGPWRWYVDSMLDSCVSPKVMQTEGISLSSFVCLARCNGAAATFSRPPPFPSSNNVSTVFNPEHATDNSLSRFRETIRLSSRSPSGPFVVAAYARDALGQTGIGHYSPIGGFHEEEDMVLLLDVARFKYPPYWVGVKDLHRAMMSIDSATGLPRGYVTINRSASVPLVLFSFSGSASLRVGATGGIGNTGNGAGDSSSTSGNCIGQGQSIDSAKAHVLAAIELINKHGASSSVEGTKAAPLSDFEAVQIAVQSLLQRRADGSSSFQLFQPLIDPSSSSCGLSTCASSTPKSVATVAKCVTRLSREQVAAAARLLADIEMTPLLALIRQAVLSDMRSVSKDYKPDPEKEARNLSSSSTTLTAECDHGQLKCVRVEASHILTMLLLTFFSQGGGSSSSKSAVQSTEEGRRNVSKQLHTLVAASMSVASPLVAAEVKLLRNQVDVDVLS
jgi:glutathione gamma-glutamylcysteinyltransferase